MDNSTMFWEGGFKNPPLPYWIASTPETNYPVLETSIKVDAAIVGGGITGITTAFLLKQEGLSVAVIEKGRILKGTTGHTTAKVTSQHSLIYYKLKKQFGNEKARQYAEANESAIDIIEEFIKQNNIECDFHRCPAYVYTLQDKYIKKIEDEIKAAQELGIEASHHSEIPLPFEVKSAMRFDKQARFHPRKYLLSLAGKIPGDGSHIFEQTKAVDIENSTDLSVVTENGRKITASNIIIASHYPFYDGYGLYFTRLYPERSYIMAVKIKEKFPEGMFISAEDPGRSLRSQEYEGGEIVLVGGEHHKTGQGGNMADHYINLKHFAEEIYELEDISFRWSTQDYTTADEVPYTGRLTSNTKNIYVATGFRKWGMTNSTVSALIIKDMIVNGESPWEEVYSPSRFSPGASAKNFVVENANVAKELVVSKLSPVSDNFVIAPGRAQVMEINGQKRGVYRDGKGETHLVDTSCTHMRCELRWNSAEKTWDCPCHGSRFTTGGTVIEGPAISPLKTDKGKSLS